MKDNRLQGKIAIVTGSRRGIGRAIALSLAGAGANLVIADIVADGGKLDGVAAEIRKMGRDSLAVRVDISSKSDVEEMVRLAVKKYGRIDILVNCAGSGYRDKLSSNAPRKTGIKLSTPILKAPGSAARRSAG